MRRLIFALAILGAGVTATQAQDSIPNVKGTHSFRRMEKCYTQNATSPSKSIVATCHMMDRVKR